MFNLPLNGQQGLSEGMLGTFFPQLTEARKEKAGAPKRRGTPAGKGGPYR
jgi:hypothetical protein